MAIAAVVLTVTELAARASWTLQPLQEDVPRMS